MEKRNIFYIVVILTLFTVLLMSQKKGNDGKWINVKSTIEILGQQRQSLSARLEQIKKDELTVQDAISKIDGQIMLLQAVQADSIQMRNQ